MSKKKTNKKVDKVEKIDPVEKKTDEINLEDQIKLEKDKFLRLFAEFENYKRRTAKERIELFSTAVSYTHLTLPTKA